MAYTRRKFNNDIKSLLHFDYPYFAEPSDGCRDEVSGETWTRQGSIKFAGAEIPADEINANTPKFGYRCAHGENANTYIKGTNVSGIWNINPANSYEIEFFLYPTASTAGAIFTLYNGGTKLFTIELNTSRQLVPSGMNAGSITQSRALELNKWQCVVIRIKSGAITGYIDGLQAFSGTVSGNALAVTEVRLLGGFIGFMDEFIFRHSAGSSAPTVPTAPYQGKLDIKLMNSFGDGKHGAVTISKDTQINAYARVTAITGTSITHSGWKQGTIEPQIGCEVMLLVTAKSGNAEEYLGAYAFRKITALNTTTSFTIDEAITAEFPGADCAKNYIVQAILVPNFTTLTITAGKIIPLTYAASTGGGIIAFRAKNNVTMSGSAMIISSGYGPERTDLQQVCHANLLDKFICNKGGGIYIICGGVFTAGANNRIGATWSGAGKGGTATKAQEGGAGGAGYGGGGGSDTDNGGLGGVGGVGGGGGGGDGANAGRAGQAGQSGSQKGAAGTGGGGAVHGSTASAGASQGIMNGARSANAGWATGGAGAGGNSGNCTGYTLAGRNSGANLILITKSLKVDPAAISTGGQGGNRSNVATGGGGTGFCYIATEEMN